MTGVQTCALPIFALMLLAVGMGTVFFILLIIIYFSKLIIVCVNKFAPEEVPIPKQTTPAAALSAEVPEKITKVIEKAVGQVAKGVKVTKITKIK